MTVHLFEVEGKKVFRGDILYHRNLHHTGGVVKAEFPPEGDFVTVRTVPVGAVPQVKISDLSWGRHPEDIEREAFINQARKNGHFRITDRDFKMWQLGKLAANNN